MEDNMKFTATQWNTVEDKEKFVEHFIKFVERDFPQHMFTKKFYNRLMHTFGHIAHYNQLGFWETFFTNSRNKAEFLKQTMEFPCYGDPTYTFCDAEREIQNQLKAKKILEKWESKAITEHNNAEYVEYQRLKSKFENA
jgi:hypothetical protein